MTYKVSKKRFKEYGGKDEYFNYIVESQVNGQHSQTRKLFNSLSNEQKKDFFDYLKYNQIKFDYTGLY